MPLETPANYKDPLGGSNSSIGNQLRTDHWQKKALIEAKKVQFFSQLADVTSMPKHMGKTIKKFHYLPLLDDRNINDQGIDAAGATTGFESTLVVRGPNASAEAGLGVPMYFIGNHATVDATAILAAKADFISWVASELPTTYAALVNGADTAIDYTELSTTTGASAYDLGYRFVLETSVNGSGNLYGSSKDVGTISSKMPALTENGGRVNRVGFKRIEVEGTFEKFGFFDEYTKESVDFDTDAELQMHINREMVMGAAEMTEDALQIDLLNGAGVIRFGGDATTTAEVTGANGATASLVSFEDLMRLDITLTENRTPKDTKVITGSRMVDTKTINAARIMYIGSELIPSIRAMVDTFSNPAFVGIQHYGAATQILEGEIGSVDQFRIVVVPEMMHWEGAGAAVGTNDGYRETGGNYDVFPMLVVGSDSFTTIGFQTDGKSVKFSIKHVKPESDNSYSRDDPYGETGFMSIKWYYGSLMLRPERIALMKVVAPW